MGPLTKRQSINRLLDVYLKELELLKRKPYVGLLRLRKLEAKIADVRERLE